MTRKVPGMARTITVPSISSILTSYRESLAGPHRTIHKEEAGFRTIYLMKIGQPAVVEPSLLQSMLRQLRARSAVALRQAWQEAGIVDHDPHH